MEITYNVLNLLIPIGCFLIPFYGMLIKNKRVTTLGWICFIMSFVMGLNGCLGYRIVENEKELAKVASQNYEAKLNNLQNSTDSAHNALKNVDSLLKSQYGLLLKIDRSGNVSIVNKNYHIENNATNNSNIGSNTEPQSKKITISSDAKTLKDDFFAKPITSISYSSQFYNIDEIFTQDTATKTITLIMEGMAFTKGSIIVAFR